MITATSVRAWELDRTPDLVDLVSAARDAGHEVLLIERPMPEAASLAALGKTFDIVAAPGGVAVEDSAGTVIDFEPAENRLLGAARIWRRLCESLVSAGPAGPGPVAVGGFAYRPSRDPAGPWSGFPALLLRVPALAVMRVRGRTFAIASAPDAEALLELTHTGVRAPAARRLDVTAALTIGLAEAANGVTTRVRLSTGKDVDVKIPAGLTDGQQIRLKGQGLASPGGAVGDLMITVTIAPHPVFKVDGTNLRLDVAITLYEAVLGAKVRVPTLDGAVEIAIPPGTSAGRSFRLKGKGLPGKSGPGDLFATARIVLPEKPDPELEDLMRRWRETKPYDVRGQ